MYDTIGNEKMKEGALEEAVDLYTQAIQAAPESPQAYVLYSNRAAAWARLNKNERSLEDARCVISV